MERKYTAIVRNSKLEYVAGMPRTQRDSPWL